MNDQVRLIIYKRKSVYDDIIVSSQSIYKYEDFIREQFEFQENEVEIHLNKKSEFQKIPLRKKGFNAYLISAYVYILARSTIYRTSAFTLLLKYINQKVIRLRNVNPVVFLRLRTPKYQFIDYGWSERIARMALERQEIDHAMSWLSTLGGAFSALGDQFDHCAKVAGKISVEQFKLSMRLGDPQLVARCNLYAALSLLQQGYLNVCRRMVKQIFKFAVRDKDIRLKRMCQGVWAKLKYFYTLRKSKINGSMR